MTYSKCPDCSGSVPNHTGVCEECGFNLMQYVHELEEWLDSLPPVEAYQEAA